MFYSPEAINSTQITRIWRIINDTLELSLEQIKEVTIEAFHGTSLKRAQEAFPDLNWTNRNPDDEIRALERLTQERPDDEDVAFRYRQALLRSGKLPSIPCLWCEGTGERQILQSDPNYRIPCYHCGAHGRRTRDQNLTDTANNERTITQTEDYFGPGWHLESDYRLTMQGLNHTSKMLTQERQLMNQALLG